MGKIKIKLLIIKIKIMLEKLREGIYCSIKEKNKTHMYRVMKLYKKSIHLINVQEFTWSIKNNHYFQDLFATQSIEIIDHTKEDSLVSKRLEEKLTQWKIFKTQILWLDSKRQISEDTKNEMLRTSSSKINRLMNLKKVLKRP